MKHFTRMLLLVLAAALSLAACGDGGTEADEAGVAAQCDSSDDCPDTAANCLTQFKGGYCGIEGCQSNDDCPDGSACVAHTDDNNYCFRICATKAECNRNRSGDNEANCSSNVDFADDGVSAKACVPPSS